MLDISSNNPAMKTSKLPLPALRSEKLLDQLRERIRYLHYSMRTEQAYVHWARAFIHFHDRRHPADMGRPEVELFLSWLTNKRKVSASTHSQAQPALLFCTACRCVDDDDLHACAQHRGRRGRPLSIQSWP